MTRPMKISTWMPPPRSALSVAALLIISIALPAIAGERHFKPLKPGCFGKLARPLAAGGYYGGVGECSDFQQLDIKRVGRVRDRRGAVYIVYDLIYSLSTGSHHGGRRVLIFSKDMKYLGQYDIDPDGEIWTEGSKIHTYGPKRDGNVIQFTKVGPPQQVYIGGDLHTFGR